MRDAAVFERLPGSGQSARVFLFTENTLTKTNPISSDENPRCDPPEAIALQMVFENTTVPVPRVRKIIRNGSPYSARFVMDRIVGRRLSDVWSHLSLLSKLGVAIQLRRYIRQLRAIKHPRSSIPGPILSQGVAECELPSIFGQMISSRGPFKTHDELTAFFDSRTERARAKTGVCRDYDRSARYVLTHGDINPRNLLVGDDGRLWMIDWEWSGFYPQWFEHIAMNNQTRNEECLTNKSNKHWQHIIPFVCGPGFNDLDWYYEMCFTLGDR